MLGQRLGQHWNNIAWMSHYLGWTVWLCLVMQHCTQTSPSQRPLKTGHNNNAGTLLGQRQRRWPNYVPTCLYMTVLKVVNQTIHAECRDHLLSWMPWMDSVLDTGVSYLIIRGSRVQVTHSLRLDRDRFCPLDVFYGSKRGRHDFRLGRGSNVNLNRAYTG